MTEQAKPPHGGDEDEQRRDLLAYGTQVVMDGRLADAASLGSRELAEGFVRRTLARLENGDEPLVVVLDGDDLGPGVSAVARAGETGVMVHTFTSLERLTMRLVSSRTVPLDEVRRAFVEAYKVGRHQTHVTARFRTMAWREEVLARQLAGERDYARVRLTEPLKL
ncbi:MAG TPA: hypothetical protein VFF08_00765 [Trueperaceae bacterium]|nr:hypothetical protein [Trueperaceae bacterium]